MADDLLLLSLPSFVVGSDCTVDDAIIRKVMEEPRFSTFSHSYIILGVVSGNTRSPKKSGIEGAREKDRGKEWRNKLERIIPLVKRDWRKLYYPNTFFSVTFTRYFLHLLSFYIRLYSRDSWSLSLLVLMPRAWKAKASSCLFDILNKHSVSSLSHNTRCRNLSRTLLEYESRKIFVYFHGSSRSKGHCVNTWTIFLVNYQHRREQIKCLILLYSRRLSPLAEIEDDG